MSEIEKYRDRKFCAVLYPEDPTHYEAVERLKSGGYTYALILHDMDVYDDDGEGYKKGEPKKPHWHVVIKFTNAVWNNATAKALGIASNYLQKCTSVDASLLYLVHEGYDEKFQYPFEAVEGPLKNRLAALLADDDEGTRAVKICDIIDACPGVIGYSELIRKAASAGLYADLRRMGAWGPLLIREHNYEFQYQDGRMAGVRKDLENFDDYQRGPWKEKNY